MLANDVIVPRPYKNYRLYFGEKSMKGIIALAEQNQKKAWGIIEETRIMEIWNSFGAEVNLVGSLKTGLLMNNLDIDFHIYSDQFSLADSFGAIAKLAENSQIKRIEYVNLLDTDEKCLEWHAWYEDREGRLWQIDMIHILNESPFAGYFEKVAQRIAKKLTPETRNAILSIKNDLPIEKKAMSIEIYQAVISDGVRNVADFLHWKTEHPNDGIVSWMP